MPQSVIPARWLFVLAALLAMPPRASLAEDSSTNVYMTGAEVRIVDPVPGDLFAAAGRISVDEAVAGDALLAAGAVDVRSRIGDDLRVAGGIVNLAGRIAGEVLIVGGSIGFSPGARVAGRTWLAGGDIAVAGRLDGGLKAYGQNILLLGEIRGRTELTGKRLEILSSARIEGDLEYSGAPEIKIHSGAKVSGRITRAESAFERSRSFFDFPVLPVLRPLLTLGLLAAGALLLALFPRFTVNSMRTVGAMPVRSLGLGAAVLFSLPPVILLLVITIIGIPVALALAALYAVALLAGYLITAFFVGERMARLVRVRGELRFRGRIGSLLVALLLLWLAAGIPYAGGIVLLVALIAGLGAMGMQAFSDYSKRGSP